MGIITVAILVIACLPAYGYLHDTHRAHMRSLAERK